MLLAGDVSQHSTAAELDCCACSISNPSRGVYGSEWNQNTVPGTLDYSVAGQVAF